MKIPGQGKQNKKIRIVLFSYAFVLIMSTQTLARLYLIEVSISETSSIRKNQGFPISEAAGCLFIPNECPRK